MVPAPVLEPLELEGVCVPPGRPHPISVPGAGSRVICGNTGARLGKVGLDSTHSIHWAPADNNGEFVITNKISS